MKHSGVTSLLGLRIHDFKINKDERTKIKQEKKKRKASENPLGQWPVVMERQTVFQYAHRSTGSLSTFKYIAVPSVAAPEEVAGIWEP